MTIEQALVRQQCFTVKDLTINGNDILAFGVEPGSMVGQILNHLLNKVLDEEIENEHEALMDEMRTFCNNWSGAI